MNKAKITKTGSSSSSNGGDSDNFYGTNSAAIRSDRGGGTVRVNKGTYTTTGSGSPAIFFIKIKPRSPNETGVFSCVEHAVEFFCFFFYESVKWTCAFIDLTSIEK